MPYRRDQTGGFAGLDEWCVTIISSINIGKSANEKFD